MEFLTTEYVAEQAKDEISALECSWEHHHQGETATRGELIGAIVDGKFSVEAEFCSCCQLFKQKNGKCNDCPLTPQKAHPHCCGGLWKKAELAFIKFKADYSNANFKAFQEAEAEICTYISGRLECKRAEQEKPKGNTCTGCKHLHKQCHPCTGFEPKESKPALRHGDYGHSSMGFELVLIGDGKDAVGYHKDGKTCYGKKQDGIYKHAGIIYGNIFDDLARNAEDLEEFEVSGQYDNEERKTLKSHIHNNNKSVWLHINTGSSYFDLDKATEIAHKILQMVAFARRKQAQKGAKE